MMHRRSAGEVMSREGRGTAAAGEAEKLGGAMIMPPFDTEISRDAVISDPQGAVFSVSTAPSL